jgi:probable rRNA maturation factor
VNSVEVNLAGVEPPAWLRRCPGFVRKVLKARGIEGWEVSILLCNDRIIRDLNRRYRRLDEPTDVLSFGQEQENELHPEPGAAGAELPGGRRRGAGEKENEPEGATPPFPPVPGQRAAGDVVISLETLRRNAAASGIPESEELKRLLIHGILHLEGMDHPNEDAEMLEVQERILALLKKERVF